MPRLLARKVGVLLSALAVLWTFNVIGAVLLTAINAQAQSTPWLVPASFLAGGLGIAYLYFAARPVLAIFADFTKLRDELRRRGP